MTSLEDLRDVITAATAEAWPQVVAAMPADGVLHGGTALAVHLRHRVSRDLDVFTFKEFEPERVEHALGKLGRLVVELKTRGTLNGVFNGTKVQFLWADGQRQLERSEVVAGMPVASISDLYATKLNAVSGRGELRDYFDLMRIEQDTHRRVEEGIGLFMARFDVDRTNPVLRHLVGALGYLDDLTDDPYLTEQFGRDITAQVKAYWRRRHPQIVRSFDAEPL